MAPKTGSDHGIKDPHDHDVLSGRGNFVNYHAGNEHFRALVRKHKVEYVKCPKPQKGKFSRIIYDEIKARKPPGRFLKQDASTKLWYDIGEKKALDKTRQALREGAPDLMKDMSGDSGDDDDDDEQQGGITRKKQSGISHDSFHNAMRSPGGLFPGDSIGSMSQTAFMQNSMNMGMASPVMTRNHLQMGMAGFSPALSMSPNMVFSPGMSSMMMTPDMQMSAQQMQTASLSAQMSRMPMSQAIPPPPMGPPSLNNTPQQQLRHELTPQQRIRNQLTPEQQLRHELTPQQQIRNQLTPQQQNRHQLTPQQQMAKHMEQQQQQQYQQQQMMMGAAGMGGMGGNANFMGGGDMMSPQQQQQQMLAMNISLMNAGQQQIPNNMMSSQSAGMMGSQMQHQQLQHQRQQQVHAQINQRRINEHEQKQLNQQQLKQLKQQQQQQQQRQIGKQQHQSATEMQMLQSKLAAIYSVDGLGPQPQAEIVTSHGGDTGRRGMVLPPHQTDRISSNSGGGRNDNGVKNNVDPSKLVEIPPGNNPRRMPPPSLLKRENSLIMEKIFEPSSPKADPTEKKKYDDHSSAHMSTMSLSMGDLNDDGNLSQVFDSSLRISTTSGSKDATVDATVHQANTSKSATSGSSLSNANALSNGGKYDDSTNNADRSSNQPWDHQGFDMSVATIGMSEAGNMSFASFGQAADGNDANDGTYSLSKVFEDSSKIPKERL